VQYRNDVIRKVFITVLFDVDASHLMLRPEKFNVETIDPSGITQCCHCCFFSLDLLFFSVLSGVLGFSLKICFFLLWSNFRNVCWITVFSIEEYNSFTGVICRVNRQ